jgi:hypothetical protein
MANNGREFFKQARAVQALPLRCGPKSLLLNLLIFADSRGEAWPSHSTLAAAVGVDRKSILNWQWELQERGLLIVDSGGGRSSSNRYRVNLQSLENSESGSQFAEINSESGSQFKNENCERGSINCEPRSINCEPRSHNPPMNSLEHPKESARTQFQKPSVQQLEAFAREHGLRFDAAAFHDHFEANGWKVGGKALMKDWRAAVRNWVRREPQFSGGPRGSAGGPAASPEALAAWDRVRAGLRMFGAVQPAKIREGFRETEWPPVWGAVKAAGGWDAISNREQSRGAFLAAFDAFKRGEQS